MRALIYAGIGLITGWLLGIWAAGFWAIIFFFAVVVELTTDDTDPRKYSDRYKLFVALFLLIGAVIGWLALNN
jgi:hypothetical protein